MRMAVVIFYWGCAALLILLSVHAEVHKDGKSDKKDSHPGRHAH
jgi:hypothetical protein